MATGWKGNWLDPMWSLAVEEQFYFFWPKIVKSLSQSKLKFLCFAIILICPLIRLGLIVLEVNPLINYVFILSRLDALAVGGLVAILYREKSKILLDRNLAVLGALFGAGIAVVYYTSPFARTFASMFVGYSFLAVFYGALLASLLHPDEKHLRTRVFSSFFLRIVGKYSYGIYLFHVPVRTLLMQYKIFSGAFVKYGISFTASHSLFVLIGFASTFFCAWVSYEGMEKRFLKLKRFFPASA